MTGGRKETRGSDVKIVKRTLADGTVKEYRYERAVRRDRAKVDGLRQIFNQYSETPEFKRLAKAWQDRKLWLFRKIEDELGWMSIERLEEREARARFYELRDKHADLPHRADKMMQALSSALAWAYDRGLIAVNHAGRIKPLVDWKASPHQEKAFTEEQEEILLNRLPRDLRTFYIVGLYTGMRRGDFINMPPSALKKDGWLVWMPSKTSKSTRVEVHIPVDKMPPLADELRKLSRDGARLFQTSTGVDWTEANLSHRWRRQMIELEMDGMRLHDVRHTTENRLADAGCTEAERNAITGRPLAAGSGRAYVARSRKLALNAFRKWWDYIEGQRRVVPLENARKISGKSQ